NGKLGEARHLPRCLGVDPIPDAEPAHLPRDLHREVTRVEALDAADPRAAVDQATPGLLGCQPQRRDRADARDDDPAPPRGRLIAQRMTALRTIVGGGRCDRLTSRTAPRYPPASRSVFIAGSVSRRVPPVWGGMPGRSYQIHGLVQRRIRARKRAEGSPRRPWLFVVGARTTRRRAGRTATARSRRPVPRPGAGGSGCRRYSPIAPRAKE